MSNVILVINAGSSSIKFSLFTATKNLSLIFHGNVNIGKVISNLTISDPNNRQLLYKELKDTNYEDLFASIFDWIGANLPAEDKLIAVGHRVVHGGTNLLEPIFVTESSIEQIRELIPLAPLHQGHNLSAIEIIANLYPSLPQIACFDTSFHQTQNRLSKLFAIPKELTSSGIIRYGFHGISYEYIASVLVHKIGNIANDRVIVAHLGNGASMCAMYQRKSIATSMGFTALDGLMMGSRCGRIDPGVILYLMEEKHYSIEQILHLLYLESGLLGVSGISGDVKKLLEMNNVDANEAIDLFCYRAALELGSLSVALGGCDALVFTAGIGENSYLIRSKICQHLQFWGIELDVNANTQNKTIISSVQSKVLVTMIPTNEETMIAKHVYNLVANSI